MFRLQVDRAAQLSLAGCPVDLAEKSMSLRFFQHYLLITLLAVLVWPPGRLSAQNGVAPESAAASRTIGVDEPTRIFAPQTEGAAPAPAVRELREKAAILVRENRLDEAVEILNSLHVQYPDDRQVLFDYVTALAWAGKYREAASLSGGFESLDAPEYALAAAAQSQRHSGRLDKAETLYRQGTAKYAGVADFTAGLALTLAEAGRVDEARAVVAEAADALDSRTRDEVTRYINDREAASAASRTVPAVSGAEAADRTETRAAAALSDDDQARRRRDQAVTLARKGDYKKSLDSLEKLHKERPEDQDVLADYITIAAWAGSNDLAGTLTKKLNRAEAPEYALSSGAASLRKAGRLREARSLYEYSVKRFPKNLDLKIGLALTLGDGGSPSKGLSLLKAEGRGASKDDSRRLAEARTYLSRQMPAPEPYKLPPRPETDYRPVQDQAVTLAREGRVAEGLEIIKNLHAQHPKDQYLLFDCVVLLQWARENEQVLALEPRLDPALIPPYAVGAVYRAYGARRDFGQADAFLEKILKTQRRNPELLVAGAQLIAEHGNPYLAAGWVEEAERAKTPGLGHQIDTVKKDIGYDRVKSLQDLDRANRYLALKPGDREALQLKSRALSNVGSPVLAREQINGGAEALPEQIHDIKLAAAMKEGRWGEQTSLTRAMMKRTGRLEDSLYSLERLQSRPDCRGKGGCVAGARMAAVRPLAALNRSEEAAAAYEGVKDSGSFVPNSTLISAGGAYISLRQPLKAAEVYQQVIDRHQAGKTAVSRDDLYEAEKGLFWSHLESERLGLAREQAKSNYVKRSLSPPDGPDWQRTDAYITMGLSETFTGHAAEGEEIFSQILKKAPGNTGALSGMSAAKSARGLPRSAWENVAVAMLHAPDNLGLAVQLANALMDLRRWREAHELIKALEPWAERSEAVKLLLRRWETHNKFEARAYIGVSHTSNRHSVSSTNPEDPDVELRLYSRPMEYNWRAYVGSAWDSGRYAEGEGEREIYLGGAEYRGEDLELNLELRSEQLKGSRMGAGLTGVWQPTDHWRFPFSAQRTSRETPLRARNSGIHADSASLGLGYYWNESRAFNVNALYMDFSDGNRRLAFYGNFNQRLWTSYSRFVTGRLNFYTSSNSENDNRPYYNPKEDFEAGAGLTYGNLIWRDYDRSLSHSLEADASNYHQKYYGSGLIWTLGYNQFLDWTDCFSASYGVSYGRRVYDGEPEKVINGYLNVVWKF